jgi:prepilin-type N-terminal cleavage/methylation domain-containing protein
MRSIRHFARRGFTLTELFVVLVIIALIIVIFLPAIGHFRCGTGGRTQCMNNLHQIGIALHCYANMHHRTGVPGVGSAQLPAGTVPNSHLEPDQRLSWIVDILPYVEEQSLYGQFDQRAGWEAAQNVGLSHATVQIFQCPSWQRVFPSEEPWKTTYVGIAGLGSDAAASPLGASNIGAFGYDRQIAFSDVKDGTSNTLMVLESARDTGSWAQGGFTTVRGINQEEKPYFGSGRPFGGTHFSENDLFSRGHSIGCNGLMMDGSARFLADTISPEVLEALATIAGGEKVPADY